MLFHIFSLLSSTVGFSTSILSWIWTANDFQVQGELVWLSIHNTEGIPIPFSDQVGEYLRSRSALVNGLQSLERLHAYTEIEQEPKPTSEGKPPAYWPTTGTLKVEDLSARYSPDGPHVLHNLSFEIRAGERIGVGEPVSFAWQ